MLTVPDIVKVGPHTIPTVPDTVKIRPTDSHGADCSWYCSDQHHVLSSAIQRESDFWWCCYWVHLVILTVIVQSVGKRCRKRLYIEPVWTERRVQKEIILGLTSRIFGCLFKMKVGWLFWFCVCADASDRYDVITYLIAGRELAEGSGWEGEGGGGGCGGGGGVAETRACATTA